MTADKRRCLLKSEAWIPRGRYVTDWVRELRSADVKFAWLIKTRPPGFDIGGVIC